MDNDDIETWAREQDRLRGDPSPDDQPTTPHLLRFCAWAGCSALLSRDVAHPCCFVHRQIRPDAISLDELRHQVIYGQLSDWPDQHGVHHRAQMFYGDDNPWSPPAA